VPNKILNRWLEHSLELQVKIRQDRQREYEQHHGGSLLAKERDQEHTKKIVSRRPSNWLKYGGYVVRQQNEQRQSNDGRCNHRNYFLKRQRKRSEQLNCHKLSKLQLHGLLNEQWTN
jgi:hypothetical protein